MEKVEADLNRSKQLREKQAAEFSKQLEKERGRHIQELAEVRLALEQEKAQILQAVHAEKEMQNSDREEEVAQVREQLQRALKEAEGRAKERQSRDSKVGTQHPGPDHGGYNHEFQPPRRVRSWKEFLLRMSPGKLTGLYEPRTGWRKVGRFGAGLGSNIFLCIGYCTVGGREDEGF